MTQMQGLTDRIPAISPLTVGLQLRDDKSKTHHYIDRQKKGAMPVKPRNTDTITFSLPPEMAEHLRQVVKDESRTMSEVLREAIRLYMEEREWQIEERMRRRRSRRTAQNENEATVLKVKRNEWRIEG